MSHSIIIYPNGMVEVTAGYDNDSDEPVAYGVVDTKEAEDVDPVAAATDVLWHHFRADEEALDAIRILDEKNINARQAARDAADPVSDALDMLDEHFANHGVMRVHLQAIRAVHNLQVWGADVHNRQVWGADVTCKAAYPGV